MQKSLLVGALVLILGAGVYAVLRDAPLMEGEMVKDTDVEMMDKNEGEKKNDTMMQDDVNAVEKGDEMMKAGTYALYSAEKLVRAETGDVILSFHASWCPSCRALDADILKNMSAIPEDLSILKVDYDTATELKKKYGVTVQNTLVQVDATGTLIAKWSGSTRLTDVLSHIK
jgi:thiol-disulfide isomerase/thioredoxin